LSPGRAEDDSACARPGNCPDKQILAPSRLMLLEVNHILPHPFSKGVGQLGNLVPVELGCPALACGLHCRQPHNKKQGELMRALLALLLVPVQM
jgi:hypothetical protein